MQTLILCGGKGTRAYPHTIDVPKPLLHVADRPVLEHLMEIYAAQGFTDFVLAGGYKIDMLADFADTIDRPWTVDVVDTGLETNTGGRVRQCFDKLDGSFFCTYADGLGDVDLRALAQFHASHEGVMTITTVPLPSQYGTVDLADDGARVTGFREKPRLPEHLINAGFFVVDQDAAEHWAGEDLERDVLPALSEAGLVYGYRHDGFWKSMDTYKDAVALTELHESGPPWIR